jgi:hypothetical protein
MADKAVATRESTEVQFFGTPTFDSAALTVCSSSAAGFVTQRQKTLPLRGDQTQLSSSLMR